MTVADLTTSQRPAVLRDDDEERGDAASIGF
jgi:hypothetical protein